MIVGIVIAKENSNRFPGKNTHIYKGKPLFWHSVEILLEAKKINDVVVATDSTKIIDYCNEKNVKTVFRGINISNDNDSLFKVLKFTFQSLNKKYSTCVSVMANCPNNTSKDIDNAVSILKDNNLMEVRSYDNNGVENGILVMNTKVLNDYTSISSYMGSITTKGKEIHFKNELNDI